MYLLSVFFFILTVAAPNYAVAHPGGRDVNGGHRVSATGQYHLHTKRGAEGSRYGDAVINVKVLRVIDGDTFLAIFPGGEVEKVRLRHKNTPERGEKGFTEATVRLENRIGNKIIEIKVGVHKKRGNYLRGHFGRVLADILDDPLS